MAWTHMRGHDDDLKPKVWIERHAMQQQAQEKMYIRRHTCFYDSTSRLNVKVGSNERDIRQVENLGAMREGHGP